MKNFREIALSIAAGTALGVVAGGTLGVLLAPLADKFLDKMEEEAYQKVWNSGVEVVEAGLDLIEAVAEVIEEEITNG